jgi:hypothetical protein
MKEKLLPGEVSIVTSWQGEVSRGHSRHGNEPPRRNKSRQGGGLTSVEGLNVKMFSKGYGVAKSDSLHQAEQGYYYY